MSEDLPAGGSPASLAAKPPHPEQGYTLQTLIITAVLVLMAVAAGVLVVAITRSASEDLEGTDPDLAARCLPWEIYSPEYAAAGAGGGGYHTKLDANDSPAPGAGGVTSSAIGCLAPCYLTLNDQYDARLDTVIQTDANYVKGLPELSSAHSFGNFDAGVNQHRAPSNFDLKFDTSNRLPVFQGTGGPGGTALGEIHIGVTYKRSRYGHTSINEMYNLEDDLDFTPNATTSYVWRSKWIARTANTGSRLDTPIAVGIREPPSREGSHIAIKVTADSKGCIIYNEVTDEIYLDSRRASAS